VSKRERERSCFNFIFLIPDSYKQTASMQHTHYIRGIDSEQNCYCNYTRNIGM